MKKLKTLKPNMKKNEERTMVKYIGTRLSKEAASAMVDIKIDNYSVSFDTRNDEVTENGDMPDIFVFNEDYVNENIGELLKIQDREIRIGQKNIQRDNLIKEKQEKEKALRKINDEIDKIVNEAKIESTYRTQKRTSEIISKENYLRKTNPGEAHPDARRRLIKLSNPPEAISDHHRYSFPFLELDDAIKTSIIEIIKKVYIEPKITQEFYKTYLSVKKNFYEDGVAIFNETKTVCPFCLTPKSENDPVLHELMHYLNSDYNETINRVQKIINIFCQKKNELEKFAVGWNALIPIINERAKDLSMTCEAEEIVIENNIIDGYINLLKTKIENMDRVFETGKLFQSYEDYINAIYEKYSGHKKMIDNVNAEIDKISSLRRSFGEKIIRNQMYMLWQKNNLRECHEKTIAELAALKIGIDSTSRLISNNRIPDFFNQMVKILGISKYELNQESYLYLKLDDNFDISKEGYRISAGERKIIAFCYFIAEVLASAESNAELSQKTIIIDDPVDSSDYEKFYSFISVIENFNNILANIFKNNEIKFGQIFIFTHSALLYERFSKKLDFYLLQLENHKTKITKPKKKMSLTTFSAYIKRITNYIKKMECTNTKDIGNYIRRLMEIICSVENIDTNDITNINASSKLNALVNHLSHESIERILDPLPVSCEYIEACIEVIEEIRDRIPYLYKSIIEKYFDGLEIEHFRAEYIKKYQGGV